MIDLNESVSEGHFAKKQLLSKDWLISWSHRSRFQMGLTLARQFAGKRVVDYGCGDGAFLAMLMAGPSAPSAAVGSEIHASIVEACRERLGNYPGLSFILVDELEETKHAGAYDAIICMEVLEHMVDVESILDRFDRMLGPSGKLLISVPVETGLPLIVKQTFRNLAGWRGIGDYPGTGSYTFAQYCKSIFAGRRQHIARTVIQEADGRLVHDHKGFNWMALRETLAERFNIEKTCGSPLTWLSPHLGSQVWFLASKRA